MQVRAVVLVRSALFFAACTRGDPPVWKGVSSPPGARDAVDASGPEAGVRTAVDAGALPQTHDEPRASSDVLATRAASLWEAIVRDDPDRAASFFFPLAAYEQVKAIAHPAADWRRRLAANFARDIHALHAELGKNPQSATFVRLEVPTAHARWMEPGDEGNKVGYYRVLGSKLRWREEGRERTFDVTSLISWRGEWYVVHLSGFK